MTLIEAMQSMANYFVALHSATGIAFNELRTITSGFNTSGTELTVTKLNGFWLYNNVGGALYANSGPPP